MSKYCLLLVFIILLPGCEILQFPFQLASGIIEAIPKLLMISDAGTPGLNNAIADEQAIPAIAADIAHTTDREKLPDGYRVLSDYLQQNRQKVEVAIIDLQDGKALQQIRHYYSRLKLNGAVSYLLIDASSLNRQQNLAGIKQELGRRGGRLYGELDE